MSLGEKSFSSGPLSKVTLGIGPGGAVANTEGVRFCSGLLFHPLAFRNVKQQALEAFLKLKDYLHSHENDQPGLLIYTSEFSSSSQVNMALQDLGYSCQERTNRESPQGRIIRFVWKRGDQAVTHISTDMVLDPWNHPDLLADQRPTDHMLYVTGGGRERSSVDASGHVTKVISRQEIIPSQSVCVFEVRF